MNARSSSSASASARELVLSGRRRRRRTPERIPWLGMRRYSGRRRLGGEDGGQRVEVVDERGGFGAQVGAAGHGLAVVASATAVLRLAPLGREEVAFLEAVERLQECGVGDIEATAGAGLDPARDLEAVHGSPGQRFEDEDVERSLEQSHSSRLGPSVLGETLGPSEKVGTGMSGRAVHRIRYWGDHSRDSCRSRRFSAYSR